ncbi:MAG: hypothetical protein Q7R35_10905 [Elusimicrobiota bacterium]|nr:hypothetical protein [Elusimicrobiota bacterium]
MTKTQGTFVYHAKQPDFIGSRLFPLTTLKEKQPVIYSRVVKKYEGREWLMKLVIPPLNCLWNDVLHMSLMHPALIYRTLSEMGFEHHRYQREWFEIPVADVAARSILYRNSTDRGDGEDLLASDFAPVSAGLVSELSVMPELNAEYYRKCLAEHKPPLLWGYAPHVLFKGELDISNYRVLNWQDPLRG